MSAPTICRACGNPMLPKGNDICDACIAEGARADTHDLTHKLWRLRDGPDRYLIAAEWFARALGLSALGICLYWLCKQLL